VSRLLLANFSYPTPHGMFRKTCDIAWACSMPMSSQPPMVRVHSRNHCMDTILRASRVPDTVACLVVLALRPLSRIRRSRMQARPDSKYPRPNPPAARG